MNILLSRTDAIGDVVLTIPMAGFLKRKYADCKVYFLGRSYTKAIIESSKYVDQFLNWDDIKRMEKNDQIRVFKDINLDWFIHVFPDKEIAKLAKLAGIKNRVGTSHRFYNLLTCNYRPNFTRKGSDLHESQLNFQLLEPLGIKQIPSLDQMKHLYGMQVDENVDVLPVTPVLGKHNVILHPKSKGSAREWGLDNFGKLIELLPQDKYQVYISGTKADGDNMADFLAKYSDKIIDLTGKLTLDQFVLFISKADSLVAASTGPLHIAASLGINAIGIYPPIKPMHPGRWRPIGENAKVLVVNKDCEDCRKEDYCACMRSITPAQVVALLGE